MSDSINIYVLRCIHCVALEYDIVIINNGVIYTVLYNKCMHILTIYIFILF